LHCILDGGRRREREKDEEEEIHRIIRSLEIIPFMFNLNRLNQPKNKKSS